MISSTGLGWLAANHPDLNYISEKKHIVGELAFRMYYNGKQPNKYVINPEEEYNLLEGTVISDVYEILITFHSKIKIPDVFEIGGRIEASAHKWNIENLSDLHVFPDNKLCLCIPLEWNLKLPNGFNLPDFFANLLIPYFYYQSYFEHNGKEPWSGYGHGDLGLLESFHRRIVANNLNSDIVDIYVKGLSPELQRKIKNKYKIKGHHKCLCGSERKVRNCHQAVLLAYNSLYKHYHANIKNKIS